VRAWVLLAALAAPAAAAQGNRFEVDLGPVDIESKGQRELKLPPLPDAEIAFGLRLAPAGSGRLDQLPKATVRITLVNELNQQVFSVAGDLADWTRSESTKAWFLYQRGIDSQARGPDGGWGTYAHPRQAGSYWMTVETVKSNVAMTKFTVRLVGIGGGAK
jgi:hypothetical protein